LRRAIAGIIGLLSPSDNCKFHAGIPARSGSARLQGETVIVRRLMLPLSLFAITAFGGQAVAQAAFPAPLPNEAAKAAFPPVNAAPAAAASAPAPVAFPPVGGAAAAPAKPAAASPFPSPTAAATSQGVFPQGNVAPLGGGLAAGAYSPQQGGPTAEQDECMAKFAPLRADAERRAKQIQVAGQRKASAQEACTLIKGYVAAETKVVNYVTAKQTACNIPPEVPKQLKANQVRSQEMMKQVCQAATGQAQGGGGAAAPPSLSEVLGSSNVPTETRSAKRGGSTFDTLNGNVLSR
jgi:hypothetical protein